MSASFGYQLTYSCNKAGMRPKGLRRERDVSLNDSFEAALRPIADAAETMGSPRMEADLLMVDTFAHATGLLLLLHTGRIRMFGASAAERMEAYVDERIRLLKQETR